MNLAELDQQVRAVCPIFGISCGSLTDKATWRIDFADAATAPQRTAAQAVLDGFDMNAVYPTAAQLEQACKDAFSGSGAVDGVKLAKAIAVSYEAYRLGKNPGALTAAEVNAARDRIAAIYRSI
jgi:hypothetical protein